MKIKAQRAMGLAKYASERRGLPQNERHMLEIVNEVLGFS